MPRDVVKSHYMMSNVNQAVVQRQPAFLESMSIRLVSSSFNDIVGKDGNLYKERLGLQVATYSNILKS